jgi:cellobiose-specific phosphotransferase system component IIA
MELKKMYSYTKKSTMIRKDTEKAKMHITWWLVHSTDQVQCSHRLKKFLTKK